MEIVGLRVEFFGGPHVGFHGGMAAGCGAADPLCSRVRVGMDFDNRRVFYKGLQFFFVLKQF